MLLTVLVMAIIGVAYFLLQEKKEKKMTHKAI